MIAKGTILTDDDILTIANACHDKIESEIYPTKHLSPTRTFYKTLSMFNIDSLYQFTNFLKEKYNIDILTDDIFIQQGIVKVIKTDKRETMLSFYKSIIRDIKLKQLLG